MASNAETYNAALDEIIKKYYSSAHAICKVLITQAGLKILSNNYLSVIIH